MDRSSDRVIVNVLRCSRAKCWTLGPAAAHGAIVVSRERVERVRNPTVATVDQLSAPLDGGIGQDVELGEDSFVAWRACGGRGGVSRVGPVYPTATIWM